MLELVMFTWLFEWVSTVIFLRQFQVKTTHCIPVISPLPLKITDLYPPLHSLLSVGIYPPPLTLFILHNISQSFHQNLYCPLDSQWYFHTIQTFSSNSPKLQALTLHSPLHNHNVKALTSANVFSRTNTLWPW